MGTNAYGVDFTEPERHQPGTINLERPIERSQLRTSISDLSSIDRQVMPGTPRQGSFLRLLTGKDPVSTQMHSEYFNQPLESVNDVQVDLNVGPMIQKRYDFIKKMTLSLSRFKDQSIEMRSIIESYLRYEIREGLDEEKKIPIQVFGIKLDKSRTLTPAPKLSKPFGHSNLELMKLFSKEGFLNLLKTWRQKGWNIHKSFTEEIESELEVRANPLDKLYSKPPINPIDLSKQEEFIRSMESLWRSKYFDSPRMMIEIGREIKFWSREASFTEDEAIDSLRRLEQLEKENPNLYSRSRAWLEKSLTKSGTESKHWSFKLTILLRLENSVYERMLESIAQSTEIVPQTIFGEDRYEVGLLAGFQARKLWIEICNNQRYERLKVKVLDALSRMELLPISHQGHNLVNFKELQSYAKAYTIIRTRKVFERQDLNQEERSLFVWSALHDPFLVKSEVKATLDSIEGSRELMKPKQIIRQGASIRDQIQSLILLVYPWAQETYQALPKLDNNGAYSIAASMFLLMRKQLEHLLNFTPHQLEHFKTELIDFLGAERYDDRLKEIFRISDELRYLIRMDEMEKRVTSEWGTVEAAEDWFRFKIESDRFQRDHPDGYPQSISIFNHFGSSELLNPTPVLAMDRLKLHMQQAMNFHVIGNIWASLQLETVPQINHFNVNLFKSIEEINRVIPFNEREAVLNYLQGHFPSDFDVHAIYLEAQMVRRRAKDQYQAWRRWELKYLKLCDTMSRSFLDKLRVIQDRLILMDRETFKQKFPKFENLIHLANNAPNRYFLIEMIEANLGKSFFDDRKFLLDYASELEKRRLEAIGKIQSHLTGN